MKLTKYLYDVLTMKYSWWNWWWNSFAGLLSLKQCYVVKRLKKDCDKREEIKKDCDKKEEIKKDCDNWKRLW